MTIENKSNALTIAKGGLKNPADWAPKPFIRPTLCRQENLKRLLKRANAEKVILMQAMHMLRDNHWGKNLGRFTDSEWNGVRVSSTGPFGQLSMEDEG